MVGAQNLTDEGYLVDRRTVRQRTLFIRIVERGLCHVSKRRIASEELVMATWKDAEAPTLLWDLINVWTTPTAATCIPLCARAM